MGRAPQGHLQCIEPTDVQSPKSPRCPAQPPPEAAGSSLPRSVGATQRGCHTPWVPRNRGIPEGSWTAPCHAAWVPRTVCAQEPGHPRGVPGWSSGSAASAPRWSCFFRRSRGCHAEGSGAGGTPPAAGTRCLLLSQLYPGGFCLSVARGSGAGVPGGVRAAVCPAASLPVAVRLIVAEWRKGIKCSH